MCALPATKNSKRIIVFGSCNLDMFFDVPDMNFFVNVGVGAEDALHFHTHKQAPGGKGANQAVAAAKAGGKVHFFGAVGKGAHARYLLENFQDLKIDISGIATVAAPTGVAVIFNKPDGRHKLVVSHGANYQAKHTQVPDRLLDKNSILVLQAETDLKQNGLLAARAKKGGATVIYNVAPASPLTPKVLACIDYLILNRPEAEVIAESLGMPSRDLPLFARAMAKKFDLACIVTLGELGIVAALNGEAVPEILPSLKVKAVDTIGAGDAFVGAFAAALAKRVPVEDALRHGIVAGSLACTRVGAQSALPTGKEIARHLPKVGIEAGVAKKKIS